jgi:hypothetical protein
MQNGYQVSFVHTRTGLRIGAGLYRKEGPFPPLAKLPGIDIKTGGTGYILIHASGHEYAWAGAPKGIASLRHEQILPEEPPPTKTQNAKNLIVSRGNRNTTLASFAGYLRTEAWRMHN